MGRLIDEHGALDGLCCDNSAQFIEKELRGWLCNNQLRTFRIEKHPANRSSTVTLPSITS